MRHKAIMLIAALSFPLCAAGQETEQDKEKTGLEKGFYCNVEISADFSYNRYSLEKRIAGKGENAKEIASKSFFGYDVTMAFGYRFIPQFTLAAGFGGGTVTKFWDTSLPVFLRLRSDILDRKVSPYVQLDLGWSFFLASKTQNITYSEKPEMYLNSCRGKYIYMIMSTAKETMATCPFPVPRDTNGMRGNGKKLREPCGGTSVTFCPAGDIPMGKADFFLCLLSA